MRAPSFPARTAAFHALALAFFGGTAAWLVQEARQLPGRQGTLGLGVAIASGGVALLCLLTLRALVGARTAVPLRSRAPADTYFQVLVAFVVLAGVGVRLAVLGGRPALVTFCAGLAVWVGALGLHLTPALLLGPDGFIDHLGKRTPFAQLEWFTLEPAPATGGEAPRVFLRAGRGKLLRLQARLLAPDAEAVRKTLLGAGVSARPPR